MKRAISIKIKAAFLLIVFALNTVVGFACAMGVDMGFNHNHHHEETVTSNHHDEKSDSDNDGCCNGAVTKLAQLDKTVPQSLYPAINPVLFTALASSYFNIDVFAEYKTTITIKYFLRSDHPPGSEIRIAIQSFQI